MACAEIQQAIDWAKQTSFGGGGSKHIYPVTAFFTRHIGEASAPGSKLGNDICNYAVGQVSYVTTPQPHLAGELQYFGNGGAGAPDMSKRPGVTFAVKVFADGTFSYQQMLNGNPVGGMPPTQVTGTCWNDLLLTATFQGGVVAIGLRREADQVLPG